MTASRDKRFADAAARNTEPILSVLRNVLPEEGRALEIASGTGQHAAAFAAAFPGIDWQPSDPSSAARDSIAAWVEEAGTANFRPPLAVDVMEPDWHALLDRPFDALLCINMIHISPWTACLGLMEGADALLAGGGLLYLYGPYKVGGGHTAPSNETFDRSLRDRDPEWGLRDMEAVIAAAGGRGLLFEDRVAMPANNFSLIFRKPAG